MSCAFAKRLIDESAAMGVTRLVITGGEPLLHSSVYDVAAHARAKSFPELGLFSNGLLPLREYLRTIRLFDFVQISIDVPPGYTPAFRQRYAEVLPDRIRLLREAGVTVRLMATLSKRTIPAVPALVDFAHNQGVHIGFNKLVADAGNPSLGAELLTPNELKSCLAMLLSLRTLGRDVGCSDPLLSILDENRRSPEVNRICGGCTAGIAAVYIRADGNVLPCPFLSVSCGNVSARPLSELWMDDEVLWSLRDRAAFDECGRCQLRNTCGGCRGAAFKSTGRLQGADPNCFLGMHS
jgi:radical SAM protein with 4Fe4S-binding SPASM domain